MTGPGPVALTSEELTAVSDALRRVYPDSVLGQRPAFRSALRRINRAKLASFGLQEPPEDGLDWWAGWTSPTSTYADARALVAALLLDPAHPDDAEYHEIPRGELR